MPFLAVDPAQAFFGVWIKDDEVQQRLQRTSSNSASSSSSIFEAGTETELALFDLDRGVHADRMSYGSVHTDAPANLNLSVRYPRRRMRGFDRISSFEDYLGKASPFATSSHVATTEDSFNPYFEIVRVALHGSMPYFELITSVKHERAGYEALWSTLSPVVRGNGGSMPERSKLETWYRAPGEGLPCNGKLRLDAQGGKLLSRLRLNPLMCGKPGRFIRKFRHGRIFELDG